MKPEDENNKPAGPSPQNASSLSNLAKQFYLQHWGLLLSAALVLAVVINLWLIK